MRRNHHFLMRTAIRRFFTRRLLVAVVGVASVGVALAHAQTTWYVDDDAPGDPGPGDPTISDPLEDGSAEHPYDAIQEGVDAAVDGDTVLVLDGRYTGDGNRDIDFGGRQITVRSENGPDTCIIDCEHAGRGFYFHTGETADAAVEGITIMNGSTYDGGGVSCESSSPTITDCKFESNWSSWYGGGMYNSDSSPTVTNCTFTANSAGAGGGMLSSYDSSPTVTNCTFNGNSAAYGGGFGCALDSVATLTNCILWANSAAQGPQIALISCYDDWCPTLSVSYSDVEGGQAAVYADEGCTLVWGEGNIDAGPSFAFADDPHLVPGSPCIDAGTNDPPGGLPPRDPDGNPRPLDGDGDGSLIADIGSYEFNPEVPSIACAPLELIFFAPEGGPNPDDQVLLIRNCGGGTLAWEIVEECPWLTVDPASGQSAGEIDEVALTVDVSGLSHGEHTYEVGIVGAEAMNSPRVVCVTLCVNWVLEVPAAYGTIQAAVDAAAVHGDTVLVADGTYTGEGNKDLDFAGKLITVRSVNGPDLCIIDCEGDGRGFYFHSGETGDAIVDGFTITNADAGGVACSRSRPTIRDCRFSGNSAVDGAGMCNGDSSPTVSNCTFSGNSAVDGAGMCNWVSRPTVSNCTFSGNSAGGWGGGMYNYNSSPMVTNCAFSANSADLGGGMANWESWYGSPTLTDCVFSNNASLRSGGGMHSRDSSPTLANCTFSGNSATYHCGGGMCNGRNSSPTLINCTFTANTATEIEYGAGGGMQNRYNSRARVTNCTFNGNSAASGGGMSNYDGSSPTVTNCIFNGNSAHWGGGGMSNSDGSSPMVANCAFIANLATGSYGDGAGMSNAGSAALTNCTFSGNSGKRGAGMSNSGSATVTNCTFSANLAEQSGGAIYNRYGSATIVNCTIAGNNTTLDGGGLHCYGDCAATVANSILWGNSATHGAEIALTDCSYEGECPRLTVAYCDVAGGEDAAYVEEGAALIWSPGNIDADPLFVDADGPDDDPNTWEDNDYRLSDGSPCIDAGCNCAVPPDVLDLDGDGDTAEYTPFDLDGEGRFFDDPATEDTGSGLPPIVDMGAYEFGGSQDPPCRGDLDGDADVDWEDLAVLLDNYGTLEGATGADGDMDCDGDVELSDLAALLSVYGTACP